MGLVLWLTGTWSKSCFTIHFLRFNGMLLKRNYDVCRLLAYWVCYRYECTWGKGRVQVSRLMCMVQGDVKTGEPSHAHGARWCEYWWAFSCAWCKVMWILVSRLMRMVQGDVNTGDPSHAQCEYWWTLSCAWCKVVNSAEPCHGLAKWFVSWISCLCVN
jgi:hypothetical protein